MHPIRSMSELRARARWGRCIWMCIMLALSLATYWLQGSQIKEHNSWKIHMDLIFRDITLPQWMDAALMERASDMFGNS